MCIAYLGRGPPHSTLGCCGIRTHWGYCPIFLAIVVVWSVEQDARTECRTRPLPSAYVFSAYMKARNPRSPLPVVAVG
ncbi:hypothetical protein OKW41_004148 [Paraburkholderia sp. UCT70]